MHTVMIIDDNEDWSNIVNLRINMEKDFSVVAEARNGKEAVLLLEHYKPQIVILDIVMPEYDGMKILGHIREMEEYDPYVYIITGLTTESIVKMLSELEIDLYSLKPVDIEAVAKNLRKMIGKPSKKAQAAESDTPSLYPAYYKNLNIGEVIDNTLIQLGIPINKSGFLHIKTSIQFAMESDAMLLSITRKVYPKVAKLFNTTSMAIERNIRTAVGFCEKNQTALYNQLKAQSNAEKMTNTVFLAMTIKHVKKQINLNAAQENEAPKRANKK